jgi:hypothetical protein
MSDASVRRERFLPYAYDRGTLALDLVRCTRDEEPLAIADPRVLELYGEWRTAELELSAQVPAVLADKLVPSSERRDPPLAVLVGLRCAATRLRRGEVMRVVDGCARGTLRLRRDELAESAELHAWLVRTKPHTRRTSGYATAAGARVAQASPWTVLVDRDESTAVRGLDVRFKSFAADPAIPLPERDNVWRLDCLADEPVLWLNLDHGPLAELLRAEGTRGQRARQRDVVFDRIVASVRTQLAMRAATNLLGEGPVYAWETAVVTDLLPRLYPQLGAGERRDRLLQDARDPAELLGRIDDALQASERTAKAILALLEES